MTFAQAIRYLERLTNYEEIPACPAGRPAWPYREELQLERVRGFLSRIYNPQDKLRCIHIAGSKGKGSTSAFIAYILRAAGYKVGLYTSPHLKDFRERIRVLNPKSLPVRQAGEIRNPKPADFEGMISRRALANLVARLKPAIDRFNTTSIYGPLTFFEVYTALAFVYFKEQKVDFAVLETGLGGRLDATNTVQSLVCAITPISYEHTDKLGHTLKKIAAEKAGIIKGKNSIVLSAPQKQEAEKVIRERCCFTGAKLVQIGQPRRKFKIKLLGRHQQVNAALAVGVIKALREKGFKIGLAAVKFGLYNTLWPGRCEVIGRNPLVVLDGAHNAASARVLQQAIRENFLYRRLILVLGLCADKDIPGICRQLLPLADALILTRADHPRSAAPGQIEKIIRRCGAKNLRLVKTKTVSEAKKKARELAAKSDLILATGSLFVVGEFRNAHS
jgi:dihydrofolate synthase/folylpolyglutamate synthase